MQVAATAYNRQRSIAIPAQRNLQLIYHQEKRTLPGHPCQTKPTTGLPPGAKSIAYSYLQKKPLNVLPP